MTASLKTTIELAVKDTMRAGDKEKLMTLRLITAAMKQQEVDTRTALDDNQILAILDKMIKERRDAIEKFDQGGRPDLSAKEAAEIIVIQAFLPPPLSDAQIDELINTAIADCAASRMQDMGKVMAQLKPQLQGRADIGDVSKRVKEKLS